MKEAYKRADGKKVEGKRVVVDVERGRTVPNWSACFHICCEHLASVQVAKHATHFPATFLASILAGSPATCDNTIAAMQSAYQESSGSKHKVQHCEPLLCYRKPRRLAGGKGGEGREPRQPKDPSKRMKAGLLPVPPPALSDRYWSWTSLPSSNL